jgi:hypothetical protein
MAPCHPPTHPYPACLTTTPAQVLYDDPWRLLLACILLNKTTATQVADTWWTVEQC